jgi:hypothetical protein
MHGMGRSFGNRFFRVALFLASAAGAACNPSPARDSLPASERPGNAGGWLELSPAWASLLHTVDADFKPGPTTVADGEALSKTHCSACHLWPAPSVLPRAAWLEVFQSLHAMFSQTGVLEGTGGAGANTGPQNNLALPSPAQQKYRFPKKAFAQIIYAYLAKAPAESLPQENKPAYAESPAPFKLRYALPMTQPALYTLAAFDAAEKRIVLGDMGSRSLQVLDASGHFLWRVPVDGGFPTGFQRRSDGLYVVASSPAGKLLRFPGSILKRKPGRAATPATILAGLNQPVHATFADLDGDSADEILVEEFGRSTGALSWFKKTGAHYRRNIIYDGPGILAAFVQDLTGDGLPDIAALISQADEAVTLYEYQGGGRFTSRPLTKQQPAFGSDAMGWGDYNRDGHPDFMTVNGDNDLQAAPLRNYHGVRIWTNDGHGNFQQAFFYPMYGTLQAIARDFDGDGDLDVVAVAPFPDMSAQGFETAVYLENTGGAHFVPHRIPGAETWPWCVLTAGDFDGDGDDDLILAAWYHPLMFKKWKQVTDRGVPLAYAVFENTAPTAKNKRAP